MYLNQRLDLGLHCHSPQKLGYEVELGVLVGHGFGYKRPFEVDFEESPHGLVVQSIQDKHFYSGRGYHTQNKHPVGSEGGRLGDK